MYLLIYEDGYDVRYSDYVKDSWLQSVDDGVGMIIRIDGDVPMEYYNGEWHRVEKV